MLSTAPFTRIRTSLLPLARVYLPVCYDLPPRLYILLTYIEGIHGANIAEWVVMTQLAHSHRLKLLMQWQKDREWGNHEKVGTVHDMVGQRIGILGYGSIGRQGVHL